MKNIIKIFKRDMKSIIKNPVALLIIGGLCIIPSLYAWVNIKACWNPYENTSTIPVAVVNNDEGTTFKGKNLNIGNTVIEKLKNNHNIGWKFVNSKDANLGIVDGTYYAMIEIPEDFSSDFTSILSDKPKKPQITYKVDTKNNPVSGKITEVAKNTLVDQITSNFISSVNETVFSSLNNIGEDAEKNKQDIINLKNDIITMNKNMDLITTMLQSINENSSNLSSFLTEMKTTIPAVGNGIDTIAQSNENNKVLIKSTQDSLNNSFNNIELNLNSAKASVYKIQALVNNLNSSISEANSSNVNSNMAQINAETSILNNEINPVIDFLQQINNSTPNSGIQKVIDSLKNTQSSLNDEKNNINSLQQQFNKTNEINKDILNSINNNIANMNLQLINAANEYNTNTKNTLNSIANNLITSTNDASDLLKSAQDLNTQIDNLMGTSIDGSQLATKVSGDLNNRLLEFKDIINRLSDKLQLITNNDLIQIITILQSDPNFMGNFMSNPFNLKEESIYEIPNYGSGMAPIYTVLALWVGSLLLTSLLKTEVAYFEGSENLTLREKHFGKMLTFITLALIQGFIVSVGDRVLLGVYTVNTFLMIVFALATSITFSIITYTLVSILGNIGKAVAIVFMIVQLAGSGGTYPIQLDPLIFRILQPLFPFTYSISGFREAIAGPLISSVALDFVALIMISIVFILIGFFFKKPLHDTVHKFEIKFKESGIGE